MHTTRTVTLLALPVAITALAGSVFAAEAREAHLTYKPDKSVETVEGPYGVSGPLSVLRLEVRLTNEDSSRPLIVEPGFFDSIRWFIEPRTKSTGQPGREPAEAAWKSGWSCGPEALTRCLTGSQVVLPPHGWLTAAVVLRWRDGRLDPGRYSVAFEGSAARGSLREADAGPWKGGFATTGAIDLIVRQVQSPKERFDHHAIEAADAIRRGDYASALAEFTAMERVVPGDQVAFGGMGQMLVLLGRYEEAAAALERALPQSNATESVVPKDLAAIYLVLGQTARADAIVSRYYGPQRDRVLNEARLQASKLAERRRR